MNHARQKEWNTAQNKRCQCIACNAKELAATGKIHERRRQNPQNPGDSRSGDDPRNRRIDRRRRLFADDVADQKNHERRTEQSVADSPEKGVVKSTLHLFLHCKRSQLVISPTGSGYFDRINEISKIAENTSSLGRTVPTFWKTTGFHLTATNERVSLGDGSALVECSTQIRKGGDDAAPQRRSRRLIIVNRLLGNEYGRLPGSLEDVPKRLVPNGGCFGRFGSRF